MNVCYGTYVNEKEFLTLEEMTKIHSQILLSIDDIDAQELYDEYVHACVRYANFRERWSIISREEKLNIDSDRTSAHNMVIIKINQLSRYLKSLGKDVSWRDNLGDEVGNPYMRKRIGDFACYVAFVCALNSR